jgi:hypothetical protein
MLERRQGHGHFFSSIARLIRLSSFHLFVSGYDGPAAMPYPSKYRLLFLMHKVKYEKQAGQEGRCLTQTIPRTMRMRKKFSAGSDAAGKKQSIS